MQIKIPVSSEVYHFVLQELCGQPIQVSAHNRHLIADKIYDLVNRPCRYQEYDVKIDYSHNLLVNICERTTKLASFDLTGEKVFRFNNFVTQLMRDRLFLMLDVMWGSTADESGRSQGGKINRIIEEYMDSYNLLGTGITHDALKKSYYRYRQSRLSSRVPAIAARCA